LCVLGGYKETSRDNCSSSVQLLQIGSQTSHKIEHMQKPRANFAAVNCGGKIYAIGGKSRQNPATNSVEVYSNYDWHYVRSMKFARRGHAACVVDGKIIVVGGVDAYLHPVHDIECYNPNTGKWNIVGRIEEPLHDHLLIAV